ncbi:MAG TPA: ABC transporter ATP-binding protein [Candidatus Dormibacteraeota bacterium]|nr:ABC transporter ATP-binding protein [Candidatus Dormibacteraeota bacterium]
MNDVVLRGVEIAYESEVVVSGLDLSVSSGEWLALIGPNGAGKTSILRAIARLVAYSGEIRIGTQAVADMSGRELARRVAMVMQEPHMPEGMSVSQYVLLGRSPHLAYFGKEGRGDQRVVADILERLALGRLAARRLDHLSGGERQRAAIARALAQQAPVLLVDEPTSSLDVGRQQEVLELIDGLRAEQGLTVIAAMHDLTLAGQYAHRLALLVAGKLVAVGSPAEVLTEPAIADHYGAQVRVLQLNGAGRAVIPIRGHAAAAVENQLP